MLKKILSKDLTFNFLIKSIAPIIGYFILLLNTRFIDSQNLGFIFLGISYIGIISRFSTLGFPQLATKYFFSELSINKSNIYKYLIAFQLIVSLMIFVVLSKVFNVNIYYLPMVLLTIIASYFSVKLKVNNHLRAFIIVGSLLTPIIQSILLLFFIFNNPLRPVYYLFFLSLTNCSIIFITSKFLINDNKLFNNFKRNNLKIFIISSLFIGFSGFLSRLNTNIDNIMIGQICGVNCIPSYKLHSMILVGSQLFCMTYNLKLTNKLSNFISLKKYKLYKLSILKGIKLNFFYNLVTSVLILLIIPRFTAFMSGGNYDLSYKLYVIFLLSGLSFSTLTYLTAANLYLGLEKIMMVINSLGVAINIILNILLIPQIGLFGAAFATLIGSLVSLSLSSLLYVKNINAK